MIEIDSKISNLNLEIQSAQISKFTPLLRQGLLIRVKAGVSVADVLANAGISRQYVERKVQTVFLDGVTIDDLASALVSPGSTLALSAAMPGLAGAIFRKESPVGLLRSRSEPSDRGRSGKVAGGFMLIKMFNLVAEEIGPKLLRKGIIVEGADLEKFLETRWELIGDYIIKAGLDGRRINPSDLFEKNFSSSKFICIRIR